ncbi:sigma-54 interaction domain-containing protein [Luteitalea sp.]|uniref:sigma-54 interaction domain-containing protein n=1 Tax=Luteitalea sp. TaxID=2004800 RepID=UPI0037C8780C
MPRQLAVRVEADHLAALLSLGPVLSEAPNLKTALARALEHVTEAVSARSGLIALREGDGRELSVAAATGISWQTAQRVRYRVGEGIIGRVVETGRPVVVPRASQEPLFLNRTGVHKRTAAAGEDTSFLCVPICAAGACVGAVGLARPHRPDADVERLMQFLGVVASLLGYAVRVHGLQQAERQQLVAENAQLREELRERYDFRNIIGSSRPMQALFGQVTQVARSQTTALIRGESGTGKELIAHAIHYHSARASKPFVKVNCGALPEGLVESELFGHEAGAFTDARTAKKGRFELAHGGTLFLDEVGELSVGTQVKLLRVLQEREFERLGGTQTIRVNVRLIAATNRDLEDAVKARTFREDLYYRLNVFSLFLPPLRDRKPDILLLADHFVEKYAAAHGKDVRRLATTAIDMLMSYHWPGNVRELENCIERAVLVATGGVIHGHDLPPSLQTAEVSGTLPRVSLASATAALETDLIQDALKTAGGNLARTARLLDTTERIVAYKVKKLGIDLRRFRRE